MPRYRMTAPTERFFPNRLGHVKPGEVVEATPVFDKDTGIQTFPDPNFFTEETETQKAIAARQDTTTTTAKAKPAKSAAAETETATPEEATN